MEEPLEYVVYQELTSGAIRHFWDTVHMYGRSISQERPHRFTGRTTSYEHEAIQLVAREAIVQLRHLSPGVNCRSFYYYPSREGYGRLIHLTSGDHETDPALLHLVRYVRVQEALYDQVTLDVIAAHVELVRLRRREAEPEASNHVVLFGRLIELQRFDPAIDPNHAHVSPEELRRILGISSNGTVATAPRNGHHRYPNLVAALPSPRNRDVVVPANSTSARPAHLEKNHDLLGQVASDIYTHLLRLDPNFDFAELLGPVPETIRAALAEWVAVHVEDLVTRLAPEGCGVSSRNDASS
ncbi:hypothetical protein D1007_20988 [Hordeum vulgare]|nr:hypothetical protein D1007_20988 [Hordeum vulgare]